MEALRRFDALVEKREDRSRAFAKLNDERSYFLPYLFLQPLPERARFAWMYPLLSAAALFSIIAVFIIPFALLPLLAILAANIGIEMFYRRRIYAYIQPLRMLSAFLAAGAAVAPEEVKRLAALRRATAWLIVETEGRDDLISVAVQYLNMFFLADVNAFVATLGIVERERETIARVWEAIGEADAATAVAKFRESLPVFAKPDFAGDTLETTSAYHPLVPDAVANSIAIARNGILVTGSNMSGKSTFLRTIAVNALLAQTIFTTCSRGWRGPLLDVKSSIGRGDDLLAGKSYYLAEVQRVGELLRDAESERKHLFVIDEIFRGTNAIERIAAARAVLAHLARQNDFVIVATHDLELVGLLADRYDSYHFRELIEQNALAFDYKLQRGPSSTRNAIAILELYDFPPDVVADAERVVALLEKRM
jgi:energy-coupling factor transporter ATP-binding protein EcfA2